MWPTYLMAAVAFGQSAGDAVRFDMMRNGGLYANTVVATTLPFASWMEVCLTGGIAVTDTHGPGDSTVGGSCSPGDVGFIVTQLSTGSWVGAMGECALLGMRLPLGQEMHILASTPFAVPAYTWIVAPSNVDGTTGLGNFGYVYHRGSDIVDYRTGNSNIVCVR